MAFSVIAGTGASGLSSSVYATGAGVLTASRQLGGAVGVAMTVAITDGVSLSDPVPPHLVDERRDRGHRNGTCGELPDGGRMLQTHLGPDLIIHAPTGGMLWQFREVLVGGAAVQVVREDDRDAGLGDGAHGDPVEVFLATSLRSSRPNVSR
jgi:hypothetical protein